MRTAAITLVSVALAACRSPTVIQVTVTTDLTCEHVGDTSITVGRLVDLEPAPPATTSTRCVDGHLGALVIVPSGDEDSPIAFRVVTAINGQRVDDCVAPAYGASCIVARRALHFIAHESLAVPVVMRGQCAGRCGDPTTTCVKGQCVPATLDSSSCVGPAGCDETALQPGTDGGASDATVPSDAPSSDGATADASTDAGPPVDAGVLGCDLTGAQAGSTRPMWYQCPSHRNRSPIVGPSAAPSLRWTRVLTGGLAASPAVAADGTLYVGRQGGVEAVFPADGGTRWTYVPADSDAGQFLSAPILAADGTLRVFDLIGATYASLDLATGSPVAPVRVVALAGATRGSPTIVGGGTVYYSSNTGELVALESNGILKWQVPRVTDDFIGPTVAADGTVLVGGNNGVTAFYPDGGPRWSTATTDAGGAGTVAVAPDGTLRIAAEGDGDLVFLRSDGAPGWRQHVSSPRSPIGLAVGDDGTTYAGTQTGLSAWATDGGAVGTYARSCWQPVIDAAGDVYAACAGLLVKFDATLHVKWTVPYPAFDGTGIAVVDSPILAQGGRIFVALGNQNPGPDGGPPDAILGYGP